MALKFVSDEEYKKNETVVPKTDKFAPVQHVEPKKVIKGGSEGQPPRMGMATRPPLQFDQAGAKITPSTYDWLNENIAQPVAGTALGLDPLAQMTGGQYNIGGALDPLAHYLSYGKSLATGAPVASPQAVSQGERELQGDTPEWVRATTEAVMGGHPYGLGGPFQRGEPGPRAEPMPRLEAPRAIEPQPSARPQPRFFGPPEAQYRPERKPGMNERFPTPTRMMPSAPEAGGRKPGSGAPITNPDRATARELEAQYRERNRQMRTARREDAALAKEGAVPEVRKRIGPSPGTWEERAAREEQANALPPEEGAKVAASLPKPERMGPSLQTGRQPREAKHHREFKSLFTERFPTAARGMPGAPEAGARKPGSRGPGDTGKGKIVARAGATAYPQQPKAPLPMTEGPARSSGMRPVVGPRGGKVPPSAPERALRGMRETSSNPIKEAWHGVQAYLSPSTASEGARGAHQIARSAIGETRRAFAQEATKLESYRKTINALDPEAKKAVRDYIQGHDDVLPALNMLKGDWLSFVKALRNTNDVIAKRFQKLPAFSQKEFEDNYLSQYWKESMRDQKVMSAKGHFMQKKYATYREGEAAGRHPKFDDPIEIEFQYIKDTNRFLAKEDALDEMLRLDYAKKLGSNEREPVGTKLLKHVGDRRIYAANDVARVWENQWGPGVFEHTDLGKLYMDTVHAMNASTAFTLGLSTKHAFNIAYGAISQEMQGFVKDIAAGRPVKAIKRIPDIPAAPVSLFRKGSALYDMFTGAPAPSGLRGKLRDKSAASHPELAKIASLLAQSNMTIADFESIYRSSGHMNWVEAYKNGILGKEFKAEVKGAIGMDPERNPISSTYRLAARTIDATMHPLFSYAIPRLKAGIFFVKMADFLEENPHATDEEQVAEAMRIADSIENVQGMMTQGNIMVAPLMKQTANLLLQAPGWTFGAIRNYTQGSWDIAKGTTKLATGQKTKAMSHNAAMVIADAITFAGINAAVQMFMGGGLPTSPLDLIAPKTGGKNPDGTDERFSAFGNVKDLLGYYNDWKGELVNKVRGPWKAAYEYFSNHDWKKQVIQDPLDPWQKQMRDVVGNILKNIGEPISIQQLGTATPGSHLSNAARAAGFTPAGQWLSNPEKTKRLEHKREVKEHGARLKFERREAARRAPVTSHLTFAKPMETSKSRLQFAH